MYVGGIYEKYLAGGVITLSTTKYYKALGRTIAMRTSSSSDITYILSDQLGSTTTTMTNGVIAKQSYYPYGATRSTTGTIPTDRLFTGQRQEPSDALGLYNYGARFYSTAIGRFVSADPKTNDGLNRYAYAKNNPLRYADPTGLDAKSDLEGLDSAFQQWKQWGGTLDEFTANLNSIQQFNDLLNLGQIPIAPNALDMHNLAGIARNLGFKDVEELLATVLSKGEAYTDVLTTESEIAGVSRVNVYWRTTFGDFIRITLRIGDQVNSPTHWQVISAQRNVAGKDIEILKNVGRLESLGRLDRPDIDYNRNSGDPPTTGGGGGGECVCGANYPVAIPPVFGSPEVSPEPVPAPGWVPFPLPG